MSARAALLLAVPFAVLGFGLRLGETLWLQPLTWRIQPFVPSGLILGLGLGLIAASAVVPLSGYFLLTRSARRRPRTWHIDLARRRFAVNASPHSKGPWTVTMGWVCGGLVLTERVPSQDRMRIAQLGAATTISIVVAAASMIMLVLLVVVNRPLLSLDPDGITVQRLGRQIRLRWDELLPAGPPRPAERNPKVLVLYQAAPAGSPPRPSRLPARRLHIDTAFLADTIRHYADNPHRRADIGTADELTALQQTS